MCKTNEMTLYAVGDCIVYMLYCTCVTFCVHAVHVSLFVSFTKQSRLLLATQVSHFC